jgi:hypothetical protein
VHVQQLKGQVGRLDGEPHRLTAAEPPCIAGVGDVQYREWEAADDAEIAAIVEVPPEPLRGVVIERTLLHRRDIDLLLRQQRIERRCGRVAPAKVVAQEAQQRRARGAAEAEAKIQQAEHQHAPAERQQCGELTRGSRCRSRRDGQRQWHQRQGSQPAWSERNQRRKPCPIGEQVHRQPQDDDHRGIHIHSSGDDAADRRVAVG